MLVLDSFCGHMMEGVKTLLKKEKTDLVVNPGGLTSNLQSLDVCINQPFKSALKQKYTEGMAGGNHQYMPTGEIKKPNLDLLCSWIKDAWDQISPELVEKRIKKSSISNSLGGTEDEFIWDSADDRVSSEDDGNSDESN